MKNLILIRHAKSDWSIEGQDDYERWLSDRWYNQIQKISEIIDFFDTQKIICSSSRRTVLTYEWLKKNSEKFSKIPVEFDKKIYDIHQNNVIDFIQMIRELPNDLDSVAIIGHNTIFDDFIKEFTKSKLHIPTWWVVEICFDTHLWSNIYKWKVVNFITPQK